ncbi:MAG: 2-dehydropantoate 2-reductase [Candidatus Lokiarchaeota archaeon]|nr:2-dehydropantoate 2-reductase [Candidatus Lokiarchaeota archaeon]
MKFIFLGMGAIGSLFAAKLYNAGYNVAGLCRGSHYERIVDEGLVFEDLNGYCTNIECSRQFQLFNDLDSAYTVFEDITKDDWIIITSKAYSVSNIVNNYQTLIKKQDFIMLLQNGIGNEGIVKKTLPYCTVFRATTTNGAFLKQPGYIKHTGQGFTKIGYPGINNRYKSDMAVSGRDKTKLLIQSFSNADLNPEYVEDIDSILWEKIFINVGINALAATRGLKNGELLEHSETKNIMKKAIKEAWNVAKAKNVEIKEDPEYYINLTFDVAKKTAHNKNSMLQDLMRNKPTEINFINGKIVEYGHKMNVYVEMNEKLTQKIKKMEQENKS